MPGCIQIPVQYTTCEITPKTVWALCAVRVVDRRKHYSQSKGCQIAAELYRELVVAPNYSNELFSGKQIIELRHLQRHFIKTSNNFHLYTVSPSQNWIHLSKTTSIQRVCSLFVPCCLGCLLHAGRQLSQLLLRLFSIILVVHDVLGFRVGGAWWRKDGMTQNFQNRNRNRFYTRLFRSNCSHFNRVSPECAIPPGGTSKC